MPSRRVDVVPGGRQLKESVVLDIYVRMDEDVKVSNRGTDEGLVECADKDGYEKGVKIAQVRERGMVVNVHLKPTPSLLELGDAPSVMTPSLPSQWVDLTAVLTRDVSLKYMRV